MIIIQGTESIETQCPPCKPPRKKSRKRAKRVVKKIKERLKLVVELEKTIH